MSRRARWAAIAGVAILLLLMPLTNCGRRTVSPSPSPVPSRPAAQEPAALEGRLTIYSALNDVTNAALKSAFERSHGAVTVDFFTLAASGELQAKIRAERSAPRADIFLGGSSEFHEPLGRDGILELYRSPNASAIDSGFKDPEGRWTGWYLGIFGLVVNTERWARDKQSSPNPLDWDDLLDPQLKGAIAMPDPAKTGGGYIFLASQLFRFDKDEARALDYMKRLDRNIGLYTDTSPLTIELVGKGEYLVGLNWGHDVLAAAKAGSPLEFIAPRDTACEIGAVSIVKGGPNPAAARAFVDWALTREAAEINGRQSNRISVLKDVPPIPGAPTLDRVKLVDYDRKWATDIKDRLVRLWQQGVGR